MLGKVYKVRANHYPADVTVEMDNLDHPIGVAFYKNILYCAENKRNAIVFKDLIGETIVNVDKLTVKKIKEKLKEMELWNEIYNRKPKNFLKINSEKHLTAGLHQKPTIPCNSRIPVEALFCMLT